jgi:polysaccharide deacetylase family protein (PEP-CTERM system associated)
MNGDPGEKKHDLLTVILEDYFHVGALSSLITPDQWYRFEPRFEQNTLNTLELLKQFDVRATFFVLGWIAEKRPDLIAEVANQGHEIANYGFRHYSVQQMTREEFREDARRSRDALELASGRRVIGYRTPQGLRSSSDLWMLDVLVEEGYVYDSSVFPWRTNVGAQHRLPYSYGNGDRQLWEFPHATLNCLGYLLPISGGNYFRQIPHTFLKYSVAHWKRSSDAPFMMYFHVWELDPDQPRISATSFLTSTRQYRNLTKMRWVLRDYLSKYKFGSIADYLGCDTRPAAPPGLEHPKASSIEVNTVTRKKAGDLASRVPITIVVPCYNERPTLPYLANTLKSVRQLLEQEYVVSLIFVDDASTDGTWDLLNRLFGQWENSRLVLHPRNLGVAAAILTGIRHATTEVVCSIDCDCSYDPHELMQMIPILTDDVDLVTASPYHEDGKVMNVPGWRLTLSKCASWLYSKILRHKLATYTSCFRVYRRSKVVNLQLHELGYLGVAETLALLDLKGGRIREFPTTLRVRILGYSKMKVVRTVVGHFKNLWRMWRMRKLIDRNRSYALGPPEATPQSLPASKKVDSSMGTFHD